MKFDDIAECPRCLAWCHDEVDGTDDGGTMLLSCCFCGYLVRVNSAVKRRLEKGRPKKADTDDKEPEDEEFRFKFGRFKGMTMPEALAQPNGKEYLVWLKDNNDKLKARIETFLATA